VIFNMPSLSHLRAGRVLAGVAVAVALVACSSKPERPKPWRQKLPAQVYAAPLVAGARVFVLAADRSVSAFDGQTGRRLWASSARVSRWPAPGGRDAGRWRHAGGGHFGPPGGHRTRSTAACAGRRRSRRRVAPTMSSAWWTWSAGVSRVWVTRSVRARFPGRVGCVECSAGRGAMDQAGAGAQWASMATTATCSAPRATARSLHGGAPTASAPGPPSGCNTVPDRAAGPGPIGRRWRCNGPGAPSCRVRTARLLNRLPTDGSPIAAAPLLAGDTLVVVTRNGGVFGLRPTE
jgi:outer membrane protein assembly factor BamB